MQNTSENGGPAASADSHSWKQPAVSVMAPSDQDTQADSYATVSLAPPTSNDVSPSDLAFSPKRVGDYEILAPIGRGGMGMVYKARHLKLNRTVALKMILAQHLADEPSIQRFHVEAEAAASLDHPNIVPIFEVGETGGHYFYTMGFVEGGDLQSFVARGLPTFEVAAALMKDIAEAVAYAHERGIVHRDLKPENILLQDLSQIDANPANRTQRLVPRITDFGLARRLEDQSDLTLTGQIIGTPGYMSPEQVAGNKEVVGPRSDIFSLGAILYYLLTGKGPFKGDTVFETLRRVREAEPAPPSSIRPFVPQELDMICRHCLQKEPGRRYQSARELAYDLALFLEHSPPSHAHVARSLFGCLRTRHALVILSCVAGAVALLWGAWFTYFQGKLTRRAPGPTTSTVAAVSITSPPQALEDPAGQSLPGPSAPVASSAVSMSMRITNRDSSAQILKLRDHGRHVQSVAWSPDDRYVASGTFDHEVKLWDAATGDLTADLAGHWNSVQEVAFSPDGHWLASAGYDNQIKIWQIPVGVEDFALTNDTEGFTSIDFSPDGKLLAAGSYDHTIWLWDLAERRPIRTFTGHGEIVTSVHFTPDGAKLVSGGEDDQVRVWDVNTAQTLAVLVGHSDDVEDVAVSPDGQLAASASHDSTIRIWNLTDFTLFDEFPVDAVWVRCVDFSPDGKELTYGIGGITPRVIVRELANGAERVIHKQHQHDILDVAFSHSGTRIASSGSDRTVYIWQLLDRHPLPSMR